MKTATRRLAGAAFAITIATGTITSVVAGPAADKAAEAEQLAASGNAAGALAAADAATDALWAATPFQVRTALFVEAADNAFGKYAPRASGAFRSGDTANIYVETAGYGFAADGDAVRISFASTIEIRTPDGLILGKSEDFTPLDWTGRAKSREVPATVAVTLPDLKAGDYQIVLTLTDQATAKAVSVMLPFSIAP